MAETTHEQNPCRRYERHFGDKTRWKQLEPKVNRDALVLLDNCPSCGPHTLEDVVSLSTEWVESLPSSRTNAGSVVTVVECNCTAPHKDRPENETGCGAIAVLTVKLWRDDQGEPAAEVHNARPATMRDRSWDEEATKWEQAMTERLSSTAEKWGQTVAALFGIFGVSLVLENDRVDTVISSQAKWPWWALTVFLFLSGLAMLYYTACRLEPGEPEDHVLGRVGGFALLLGFAFLVIGFALRPEAGVAFGLLAVAAATSGLAATASAGLAAQGSPKWVPYLTGDLMRRLRVQKAAESVRNLRRARLATAIAVVGLGFALGVLWYAPGSDAGRQRVAVTTQDRTDPCGEILSRSGPGLALDPPGDEGRVVVPRGQIVSVRATDKCPGSE